MSSDNPICCNISGSNPFLVGPSAVMTNSTSLYYWGFSSRLDRDTPSPRQPFCHCTSIPGQRILQTWKNTEPEGCKASQMGGCLHHQFGRGRMSPHQTLHSDPEGGFTVSLPTALHLQSSGSHHSSCPEQTCSMGEAFHSLQCCGHSVRGTRPDNALYHWVMLPTCSCQTMLAYWHRHSQVGWTAVKSVTAATSHQLYKYYSLFKPQRCAKCLLYGCFIQSFWTIQSYSITQFSWPAWIHHALLQCLKKNLSCCHCSLNHR